MASHVPSYRVVETVAREEGVSPAELSPPLYSVVDPEALDALIQTDADSDTGQVEIEFTYLDYVVEVRNGPTVSVSVQEEEIPTDNLESVPEQ